MSRAGVIPYSAWGPHLDLTSKNFNSVMGLRPSPRLHCTDKASESAQGESQQKQVGKKC